MKKIVLAVLLFAGVERIAIAQGGRSADGCQAPAYCAPNCSNPPANNRGLDTPRGAYVRSPETGEQSGESTSYGLRGLGLKLPAISLEFPELRLGGLVKYRRTPEMHVEGSRAPWVEGRALEFNQVPRNIEANDRSIEPQPRDTCVPPAPGCTTATEKLLRDELARKESEILQMQDRFGQLENVVNRLAESQEQTHEAAYRPRRAAPQPKIVEAGFYEEETNDAEEYVEPPVRRAAPRSTRVAEVPPASTPRPSTPVRRVAPAPRELELPTPPNVGFSYIPDEGDAAAVDDGLGVWKGEARRSAAKPGNGSAKRSSR